MKQIICFIWIFFLWPTMARAQDLAAELFFNQDPGRGNGVHVNLLSGETVDEVLVQAAGSLDPGVHRAFLRLRENHVWSHYSFLGKIQVIQSSQPGLSGGIYFFNEIPPNEGLINHEFEPTDQIDRVFSLNLQDLPEGRNYMYYRLSDGRNYSHYVPIAFNVSSKEQVTYPITGGEFFFNEDPGMGNATFVAVEPGDNVNATFDLSAAGLSGGRHNLYYRLTNGRTWSHYYYVPFMVTEQSSGIPDLVLLEYSVEGVANDVWRTIPTGPVVMVDGDYDLSLEGVPVGSHMLLVRLSDAGQGFSHLATFEIRVCGGIETFIEMRWDALVGNASIEADGWQWLLNGDTIPNATQKEYIPVENGLYRVIVYYDGCADVSDEVNYTQVSTEKIAGAGTRIFPNPARDQVRIRSANDIKQISITDITGRVRLIQTPLE